MHYAVWMEGEERHVEISEVSPHRFRLVMAGRAIEVDAHAITDHTLSLLVDGEAYTIESEKDAKGGENLLVRGHVLHVEVLDLRRQHLRKAQNSTAQSEGLITVTSPMPGKIVAVFVQEGQEVAAGQSLLVVEAMKMENELRAPKAGVVKKLSASAGTAVEGGAILCVVE